ncbi:MAG: type I-E CRISPR-associated protein Cas5/CasD [Proteobacteria bacterium]|nr:type I-E CRISPR-associated protein Cas5/CasD [Pseudomonadota bacterium]
MSTLLLQLKAPMQSWGISAKFDSRSTEQVPSKSAVIGMIAGALGRKRNESIEDLNVLRFGVRVDREGTLLRDFQTAKNPNKKTSVYGKPGIYRDYLADAAFLVGLEGDEVLLETIAHALKHPVYPIFLGRRSCPPDGRVVLGIKSDTLINALKAEPWLVDHAEHDGKVRFVFDAAPDEEESYILCDNAVSFDQNCRRFAFRRVCDIRDHTNHAIFAESEREPDTTHDPMADLF